MKTEFSPTATPASTVERPSTNESGPEPVPFDVFPYHVGEANAQRARTVHLDSSARRASSRTRSTDCPDCSGATVNGAGLYACTACPWSGSR